MNRIVTAKICLFLLVSLSCFLSATNMSIELNEHLVYNNFDSRLIVEYPYLYTLYPTHLEIFKIEEEGLESVSLLPVHSADSFIKKDNYIYIGNSIATVFQFNFPETEILKINVSSPENAFIEDSISIPLPVTLSYLLSLGEYIQAGHGRQQMTNIYNHPDLNQITTLPLSPLNGETIFLRELNDNISISLQNLYHMEVYDHSDIENVEFLSSVDISNLHGSYHPMRVETINDSVFVAVGQTMFSFWNYSNPYDLQYISHYYPQNLYGGASTNFEIINESTIIHFLQGFEYIDISDIYNPQFMGYEYIYETHQLTCKHFVMEDDIAYLSSSRGFMRYHIDVQNYESTFIDQYNSYRGFSYGLLHEDYLYMRSIDGIYMFDLHDFDNVQPFYGDFFIPEYRIPYLLYGKPIFTHDDVTKMLLFYRDQGEDEIVEYHIYDITSPLEPELLNIIEHDNYMGMLWSTPYLNDDEPDALYLCFFQGMDQITLKKYDISTQNQAPVLFEFDDVPAHFFVMHDSYGYILHNHSDSGPQSLYVLDGLEENDPQVINTLHYFPNNNYWTVLRRVQDYLVLSSLSGDQHKFYDLSDPLLPEFAFELRYPGHFLNSHGNLVFTSLLSRILMVYDVNDSQNDILSPVGYKHVGRRFINSHYKEKEGNGLLFCILSTAISAYDVDYTPISADEPAILPPEVTFANFPNPFNTETTFAINLPEINEDTVIELYNIKGQLIRKLEVPPSEESVTHITWDGRNSRGRVAASGIYLAKLRNGGETYTHKVVLLK